ncbi:MAG: hypothetical protein WDO73_26975 [Ignavibacteriota bacterium]
MPLIEQFHATSARPVLYDEDLQKRIVVDGYRFDSNRIAPLGLLGREPPDPLDGRKDRLFSASRPLQPRRHMAAVDRAVAAMRLGIRITYRRDRGGLSDFPVVGNGSKIT